LSTLEVFVFYGILYLYQSCCDGGLFTSIFHVASTWYTVNIIDNDWHYKQCGYQSRQTGARACGAMNEDYYLDCQSNPIQQTNYSVQTTY
jgi:hypothetical protein